MSHRFQVLLEDANGNGVEGFSVSVVSVSVQVDQIQVETALSHEYFDMPERLKELDTFKITIRLMDGKMVDGEPTSIKTITEMVKLKSTVMDLDHHIEEPVPVLYTLQKINT